MSNQAPDKKCATAVERKGTSREMPNARPAPTTFGLEPPITLKQGRRGEEKANAKGEKAKVGAEEKLRAKDAKEMPSPQAKKARFRANTSISEMATVVLETGATTVMKQKGEREKRRHGRQGFKVQSRAKKT